MNVASAMCVLISLLFPCPLLPMSSIFVNPPILTLQDLLSTTSSMPSLFIPTHSITASNFGFNFFPHLVWLKSPHPFIPNKCIHCNKCIHFYWTRPDDCLYTSVKWKNIQIKRDCKIILMLTVKKIYLIIAFTKTSFFIGLR